MLRQDNADIRLTKIGHDIGLISDERYNKLLEKERLIAEEMERVKSVNIGANKEVLEFLNEHESTELKSGTTLVELIRRPELNYDMLEKIDKNRPELPDDVKEQVNINIKYEGYITRQLKQVEQFKKLEKKKLSPDFDYEQIKGLRKEAIQKLNQFKPLSVGQASRISGVSPADISVLLIYLNSKR